MTGSSADYDDIFNIVIYWEYSIEKEKEAVPFKSAEKCGVSSNGLELFYWAAIESILTPTVTIWIGNLSAKGERRLNKVVPTLSKKKKKKKKGLFPPSNKFFSTTTFPKSTYPEAVCLLNNLNSPQDAYLVGLKFWAGTMHLRHLMHFI